MTSKILHFEVIAEGRVRYFFGQSAERELAVWIADLVERGVPYRVARRVDSEWIPVDQ